MFKKTMFHEIGRTVLPALALFALAAPVQAGTRAGDPLQGDGRTSPFYAWNGSVPQHPGRLLRSEPLPDVLGLEGTGAQYRILYVSTDGVGGKKPVAVSGALFVPAGTPPEGGWPVIAWAHGTFGMADICAPSWHGRSYRDVRFLQSWLKNGFAVVATDYQGLGGPGPNPALNNRANAYALIDSVRAALSLHAAQLANRVIFVGQSQGGSAVAAASGYAPAYAPAVNWLATVATGTIYTPEERDQVLNGRPLSSQPDPTVAYQYYSVLAAQQTDPTIRAEEIFTPKALPLFRQARIYCLDSLEGDAVETRLSPAAALKPEGQARLKSWWHEALKLPTVHFERPIFIGAGGKDGLFTAQKQLAADACAAGSVVEAHAYHDLGHSDTLNASQPDSLRFVQTVLAGKPIQPHCAIE